MHLNLPSMGFPRAARALFETVMAKHGAERGEAVMRGDRPPSWCCVERRGRSRVRCALGAVRTATPSPMAESAPSAATLAYAVGDASQLQLFAAEGKAWAGELALASSHLALVGA